MEGIWLISYIVLWLIVLSLIVLVLLLYRQLGIMYLGSAEGVSRDGLARGSAAPDFALTDQYGHPQRLAAYRGKPTALIFGSPNCGPCRLLIPQLHEWAKKHPDMNVLWLNAATPEESARFVADVGATIPVAPYSPETKLLDTYKVRVTPFLFMLDDGGVIRAKGLVNNKSGLDLYYREMKTGKFEEAAEDETEDEAVLQEVTH
ncbi:MAG TPA: TlpA disulfide reductase family protein [Chloroflexia bacterium]|jgi:methylamine dehydrogenase accessory protein MauD|nr:TlpA disulfide reductase family protein [Chloroflexia bacterium]